MAAATPAGSVQLDHRRLLLKFFNLKERLRLRMNFDVFNVFNVQGLNPPGSDGIVTLQNSYGGFGLRPRQVQVNARLEW